jgi:membrane associated rhomboid family serine protease
MGYRDYYSPSEEHQPITYVRGYPLYATHLIVAVYVVSMVVTTILGPSGGILGMWLPFSTVEVLNGQIWRVFTYGLVNPPSLRFAIDMVMIVWFGREVEHYLGRNKFLGLYAGIYLLPPAFLTAFGPWLPSALVGEFGALALFVAFATLHPNAPLMFNVLAKWAAIILVGIFTMMALANRDWTWLISIWAANGFAFAFIRNQQGLLELPKFTLWRRKPKLRVLPDLPPKKLPSPKAPEEHSMAEIDALLDKIATSGMSSLTAKEKAKLNAAREGLIKREPRGS